MHSAVENSPQGSRVHSSCSVLPPHPDWRWVQVYLYLGLKAEQSDAKLTREKGFLHLSCWLPASHSVPPPPTQSIKNLWMPILKINY